MSKKTHLFKDAVKLYIFVFLVWGFYRLLFRFPDNIEELIIKPIIWLGPVFWFLGKEKTSLSSIGWSFKNLFKNLYLGLSFGIFFGILAFATHLAKYQGASFVQLANFQDPNFLLLALGVSFVTAISEETVFRGFIFSRLLMVFKEEWPANLLSSLAWALVHLPITIFIFHYDLPQLTAYLALIFVFGLGSAFVFARTGTIVASVLLSVFWGWPILLFR
ncbi:MAG: CPBP family intramembrane metalloprotease [bacterium]|nr:CPBP family intramembrane metalloprotease [bacterium]